MASGTIKRTLTFDDMQVVRAQTTGGQTLTITASAIHAILMAFAGSNEARCGMYSLISWAGSADGGAATAIKAASSSGVTITKTTTGWTVETGTGTRSFTLLVLQGEITGASAA